MNTGETRSVGEPEKLEIWAIVELMGHRKLAGWVTEQIVAGQPLLRIDVPEIPDAEAEPAQPGFTQFYGPQEIYSLTPTTEEIARRFAAYRRERPVSVYELNALPGASPDSANASERETDFAK